MLKGHLVCFAVYFQFSLTLYVAYAVLIHQVYILRRAPLFLMNFKILNISKRTKIEQSISKLVKKNLRSDFFHFAFADML